MKKALKQAAEMKHAWILFPTLARYAVQLK